MPKPTPAYHQQETRNDGVERIVVGVVPNCPQFDEVDGGSRSRASGEDARALVGGAPLFFELSFQPLCPHRWQGRTVKFSALFDYSGVMQLRFRLRGVFRPQTIILILSLLAMVFSHVLATRRFYVEYTPNASHEAAPDDWIQERDGLLQQSQVLSAVSKLLVSNDSSTTDNAQNRGFGADANDNAMSNLVIDPERTMPHSVHLCTTSKPTVPNSGITNFSIPYICAGNVYEEFGRKLRNLVRETDDEYWGHRPFPIPANRTVLFLGDSHTAQLVNEMICQYASAMESFTVPGTGYYGWYSTAVFSNGARFVHASNSPLIYSPRWPNHIGRAFGIPLADYSLLVIGHFHINRPTVLVTNFGQAMVRHSTGDIDFETIPPPNLDDIFRLFAGPVIGLSMFAARDASHAASFRKAVLRHNRTTTTRSIDSRRYVPQLGECGSPNRRAALLVRDCNNQETQNHMHRCVGQHGGHPDLVAWDVIEAMYALLPEMVGG